MKYLIRVEMEMEIEADTAQEAYKISQHFTSKDNRIAIVDRDTKRVWDEKWNNCSVDFEDNEF